MKHVHGDKIDGLQMRDALGNALRVPAETPRFTHLMFRRWAGCPICSTHLAAYVRGRERLARAGIRTVVIFASTAEEIRASANGALPFDFVPDPEESYFRAFGVGRSLWANVHWRAIAANLSGWLGGRGSLRTVRRLNGLPADMLLRADGFVVDSYAGDHAFDQWTVEETIATAGALGDRAVA
jgi:peroxiredoxin